MWQIPVGGFPIYKTSLSHAVPITLQAFSPAFMRSHSTNVGQCPTVSEEGFPSTYRLSRHRRRRGAVCMPRSAQDTYALEFWDAEDGLHHRAEIAAAAQVLEPCVPWAAEHGLQLCPRLPDHLPLADPWLGCRLSWSPFSVWGKISEEIQLWRWLSFQDHILLNYF